MNQPKQISNPWAEEGLKNNIPSRRTVELPQESATYQEGFPSITMTPISVGGKPPSGRDMNGILHELSSHIAFTNRGKHYKFNQEFCDKINGYPKGAILINDQENALYISLVNQNKTNFNADPSDNWKVIADTDLKSALLSEINKKSVVSVIKGIINNGAVLPLPAGYSENQCHWIVSMSEDVSLDRIENTNTGYTKSECYVDGNRRVVARVFSKAGANLDSATGKKFDNSRANYLVIGVK